MRPDVELVSTGSELLSGRTVNRHAQLLGQRLQPLGLRLTRDTTVGDDLDTIAAAVTDALERVDLVFTSGGLGPTSDDVTRDAVAQVAGRKVVRDEACWRLLRQRYRQRGRTFTEAAGRQALIVEGATPLHNAVGAAPGERVELDGKVIFVLPGPPGEFRAVLDDHVLPWLAEQFAEPQLPLERVLLTTGLAESDIVSCLDEAGFPPDGVDAAYCAGPGRVEIRLAAPAGEERRMEEAVARARELLGEAIFSEQHEELQDVVAAVLTDQGKTVAVAESCTGGMLADRLTSVSGSSTYFMGGLVAYANASKVRDLKVNAELLEREGAVSETVARRMAEGVRERFETDYGIGVTGIAGPTGGTPGKPVGLVFIAVAEEGETTAARHQFPGDRELVKAWSCMTALNMLRKRLAANKGS